MALPPTLLQHVEQHPCFSGCYSSWGALQLCTDPAQPLETALVASCEDCLARISVPAALLPAGTDAYQLAAQVSDHLRAIRGFTLAKSGYHATGPGFWLGVVYYQSCGLFLLDGERSRSQGTDLHLLQEAFRLGILAPPDRRMTNATLFTTEAVHVRFVGATRAPQTKQDFLNSAQCQRQAGPGWRKVTLAQFTPLATAPSPPPGPAPAPACVPPKAPTPQGKRKVGDICPVCKAEVRVRQLLVGTFVGCLC